MVVVEVSFAISAGILTAFSPCGVPFLPNIVSFYLRDDKQALHGGAGSAVFSLGLLVVLVPLMLVAISAAASLAPFLGQFVLISGLATLLMAVAYWKGRTIPFPGLRVSTENRGYRSLFGMGAAYVVAAVGCTPALLLGVTSTAIAVGSLSSSTLILVVYVSSVVVPTLLLSLLAAEYRDSYRERILRWIRPIQKVSLGLMFGMAAYLILFYILYTFYGLPV